MNQLRDLPNFQGYRFWGVKGDGSLVECVVGKRAGCWSWYDHNHNAIALIGWEFWREHKAEPPPPYFLTGQK